MATPVIMPKFEMTQATGTIIRWLKTEGDRVEKGDPLAEVETDKVVQEIEAPIGGVLRGISVAPGQVVPVTQVIAYIVGTDEDWNGTQTAVAPNVASGPAARSLPEDAPVRATPVAQRLANDLGIDLHQVAGTGVGGRVERADVEGVARVRATPSARRIARELGVSLGVQGSGPHGRVQGWDVRGAASMRDAERAASAAGVGETVEPLSGIRAAIARHMAAAAHSVAQVTLTAEADASELVRWHDRLKVTLKDQGVVPSYSDFLLTLVARALVEHPRLNAWLLEDGLHLVHTINIGLAVNTERGLLVPVVRDVADKRLGQIAREVRALVARARAGGATAEDLTGGTFTITNLGMLDVDVFTPIINTPEVAILGVGRIATRPWWDGQQFVPRPLMVLSLSVDHRAIDGAPAARFLKRLVQLIQEPYLLVL